MTLTHILGPILVIIKICHFLMIPGPFEYFSENGWSQKIKVFLMKEQLLPPYQFSSRTGPWATSWANLIPNQQCLGGYHRLLKVEYHFCDTFTKS